ncbi:TPA: glycosyltransferase family 2 protein [Escherichia coli]|uniref:glycosyltransferase family 2 protein n=3 Tax=Escherichia coli TaxID=562 RepID=UPI000A6FA76E|nr:glycosyltransferase family 2 protein [Escherichia coli]MCF3327020.1 glycosyltransferase family 2 protein [Escherichia coli]MCH6384423.1 glycosyltransferase family 2 protein [Escherichia coli]MCH6398354.1 glycosyltransferase family 2 protein [Escherichia coli]MCH6407565.1 glycosyltransferase family 2 protein [Escherichia coli]MCP3520570.1 glycosyltransferase family 2 protein [Escherichia coli]
MMVQENIKVDIVLATYNSNGYIKEQLQSILQQTYKNLKVLIRDDGSSDDTVEIIQEIIKSDKRVCLINDDLPSNGVGENFKILLKHCESKFVLLSDQDDVWLPEKVATLVEFAEKNFKDEEPSLAYAPGRVVDSMLIDTGVLTNYKNKATNLRDIFLMNGGIQGCAMIINKALYKKALEKNIFWYMHDQVLTLFALTFGKTYFIKKPLFLYRQHSFNVIGYNSSSLVMKLKKYLLCKPTTFLISKESYQLFKIFYGHYNAEMSGENRNLMSKVIKCKDKSIMLMLCFIFRNNITLNDSLPRALIKCCIAKKIVE